jgi:hypothetical protein
MSGQVMWQRELAEARLAAWHFSWQTGLQFGQMTCSLVMCCGVLLSFPSLDAFSVAARC